MSVGWLVYRKFLLDFRSTGSVVQRPGNPGNPENPENPIWIQLYGHFKDLFWTPIPPQTMSVSVGAHQFKLFMASHGVCAICYNKHVARQLVKPFITLLPMPHISLSACECLRLMIYSCQSFISFFVFFFFFLVALSWAHLFMVRPFFFCKLNFRLGYCVLLTWANGNWFRATAGQC